MGQTSCNSHRPTTSGQVHSDSFPRTGRVDSPALMRVMNASVVCIPSRKGGGGDDDDDGDVFGERR